ncbi:hypothetical protein LOD99_8751 [Oopsacas minuta]|uniref:E3 ubiquitin-protein ligase RNF170 n=1 Tax=Oopsacas minuta TaxID=111878 RepID=A0AAV7JGH8_9METZ|nr:hypothetical protein LOD99_8751 [Oopsacas minuta]
MQLSLILLLSIADMNIDTILSYNIIPIEGLAPELVNSLFLFLLSSIAAAVAVYVHGCRVNRGIHPALLDQVEEVRTNLVALPQAPDREGLPHQDSCPICMTPPTLPVETNCGHIFCINCFTMYWTHVGDFSTTKCPMCRSRVTLLMLTQPRETYAADTDNLQKVEAYNRRHSGQPRTLIEQLYDTPAFLRHMFREFFTPGMLHITYIGRIIVILIGLLIYLLSPLDIIPESVFGIFGLVDDIFIALIILCSLGNMYRALLIDRDYRD